MLGKKVWVRKMTFLESCAETFTCLFPRFGGFTPSRSLLHAAAPVSWQDIMIPRMTSFTPTLCRVGTILSARPFIDDLVKKHLTLVPGSLN